MHTSPVSDSYPWEQLDLIPPDRMQLTMSLSMIGPSERLSCTLELRSGAERELVGLQTFGSALGSVELAEILAEVARWTTGALGRISPF